MGDKEKKDREILENWERIDGKVDINEDQTYDMLILEKEGCLNVGGLPDEGVESITIKIGKLQVDKSQSGRENYDFMFTAPRERELSIYLNIDDLQNNIRILRYGIDGLDGRPGGSGGDGGDSEFGMGGKGGDGGDGENGQDGGDCPEVFIVYHSFNESKVEYEYRISKGGRGGAGGSGGRGGLCKDKKSRALDGADGRKGADGRPGQKGSIQIRRNENV